MREDLDRNVEDEEGPVKVGVVFETDDRKVYVEVRVQRQVQNRSGRSYKKARILMAGKSESELEYAISVNTGAAAEQANEEDGSNIDPEEMIRLAIENYHRAMADPKLEENLKFWFGG